jgi:tRNA(Ile)-lysidine synthase
MKTVEQIFSDALFRARACGPVSRLGVAVSGGGDSIALLLLAQLWGQANGVTIVGATVDHGLRSDAATEAAFVGEVCVNHNIAHEILKWDEKPQGNVQGAARAARYKLLAGWATRQNLDAVLLGHNSDDQAETFLMRLARGSGVDGLSTMNFDWTDQSVRWLRPVIAASRDSLRQWLTVRGQTWVEDPSNEDLRFERVRLRKSMENMDKVGLDRKRLVDTA